MCKAYVSLFNRISVAVAVLAVFLTWNSGSEIRLCPVELQFNPFPTSSVRMRILLLLWKGVINYFCTWITRATEQESLVTGAEFKPWTIAASLKP